MSAALALPPYAPTPPTARVIPFRLVTEAEYLQRDAALPDGRLEFYDGHVVAMAGAQPAHNDIVANVLTWLHRQLRGRGCRARAADQRVQLSTKRSYVYPDVVVGCGELRYNSATNPPSLLNPTLIVEVLSDSTAALDRGRKFQLYQTLPSLRYYLLLDSQQVRAELLAREPDADIWTLRTAEGLDVSLELPALGIALPLAEIYDAVVFGEGEAPPEAADAPPE